MRKSKKYLILFFTFFATSSNKLNAIEPINSWEKAKTEIHHMSRTEKVFIDNSYVQSYKDKLGIWKKALYGTDLIEYVKLYQADIDEIILINDLPKNSRKIFGSQWLFIPYSVSYIENLEKSGINRIVWDVAKEEYIWPVEGVRITSRLGQRWGKFHPGVDIATPTGTLVLAAMDGEINEAKYMGDYGKFVVLNHNEFYVTIYAHLSELFVKKGDKVKKGQVLGLSGTTGRSTGPHLHFEVRYMNVVLNPEVFLPMFKESMYALARNEDPFEDSGIPKQQ